MHFVFTTLGYHPDQVGGTFRYVQELAEGLARLGHTVHVVYPGSTVGARLHEQELRDGVQLHRFSVHRGAFFYNWLDRNNAALERLKIVRPANYPSILVSCHGYFSSAVARSGEPMVSLFTGAWAEEFLTSKRLRRHRRARKIFARALWRLESVALKKSRSVFTTTRFLQENLKVWHPEIWQPAHLIEPGVNLERFTPLGKTKSSEFTFLSVGMTARTVEIIDSFQALALENLNTKLWIAGEGTLRGALELRVKIFGLEERVRLLGFVPDEELAKLYFQANCTITESQVVALESQACGTPAISVEEMRAALKEPQMLRSAIDCREYAEQFSWAEKVGAFERVCLGLTEARE